MSRSVLIVEDDLELAEQLRGGLRELGFDTRVAASAAAALEELGQRRVDVLVTDIHLGEMSGIELCAALKRDRPELLSIVITAAWGLESAIEAMRAGAYDYVAKPIKLDTLALAIDRALSQIKLRRELDRIRAVVRGREPGDSILGTSAAVRTLRELVARVADHDAPVLITGESGTGKELVARELHAQSSRREQPFVAINCAAMPAPLLESELFGHVRGAFTDARSARTGLFAQAGAGTIFLDEIGDMPLEMQVKLLRVLQERTFRPVGSDHEEPVQARVVTATNRDLQVEVDAKRFREDLFYRIAVIPIAIPPLRARDGDVLFLAHHFLARTAARANKAVEGLSLVAARRLMEYDWPGNVRELENCMQRAVALCRLSEITVEDLPPKIFAAPGTLVLSNGIEDMLTIDALGRRYARQVLTAVAGNKSAAARVLGIDRRSLYRRLEDPDAERIASPPAVIDEPSPGAP